MSLIDEKCLHCGKQLPLDPVFIKHQEYVWLFCDFQCLEERLRQNSNLLTDIEGEACGVADPNINPGDVER